MEKTIKCAECSVEFTFEENPKFPRKYCLNCSAKKKKDFTDNIEREPVKVGSVDKAMDALMEEKKEVYDKHKVDRYIEIDTKPKSNGFKIKLTEENIRIGALDCTLKWYHESVPADGAFWAKVKEFEKYIRFGE